MTEYEVEVTWKYTFVAEDEERPVLAVTQFNEQLAAVQGALEAQGVTDGTFEYTLRPV